MAGFPKQGKLTETGRNPEKLAVPVSVSLFSFVLSQQGPGPRKKIRG
jgi:hypothetical protein